METKIKIIFFGTDQFSIGVLEELKKADLLPEIIIAPPSKKGGRGNEIIDPPILDWAKDEGVEFLQVQDLNEKFIEEMRAKDPDLFVVASYGKIIPGEILEIPKYKSLNVHPSLLPLYRGAAPIQNAILDDSKETGVTIMKMDEKMDHGPILTQEFVIFEKWPTRPEVEQILAQKGGEILAKIIPQWISGQIAEQEQDHQAATFTKMVKKTDAEIDLKDDPYKNFLKVQAYTGWPRAFFFAEKADKKIRVVITKAHFDYDKNELVIDRVIPEGKSEMDYIAFLSNL